MGDFFYHLYRKLSRAEYKRILTLMEGAKTREGALELPWRTAGRTVRGLNRKQDLDNFPLSRAWLRDKTGESVTLKGYESSHMAKPPPG